MPVIVYSIHISYVQVNFGWTTYWESGNIILQCAVKFYVRYAYVRILVVYYVTLKIKL